MHPYTISPTARERALRIRGKFVNEAPLVAARTALLVVDMQNYFVAEGRPTSVAAARAIVPTINRLAAALRQAGALVVWIQTTAVGARERWAQHHAGVLTPERARQRLAGLDEAGPDFPLYVALEPKPFDLRVKKIHYSAFIAGSSTLDADLRARGIDSVLVAGTATNVCCESTARDAMMLDYRVVMVADANAAGSDAEHQATLDLFISFFGDVLTADEVVQRLQA